MDIRYLQTLGVMALILSAVGCDKQIAQKVTVNVRDWTASPESMRLHAAIGCTGDYIEAARSEDKTFTFATSSTRGGIGVVTQEVALCFPSDHEWRQLWSSRHGGGAKEILIKCDSETSCIDEVIY